MLVNDPKDIFECVWIHLKFQLKKIKNLMLNYWEFYPKALHPLGMNEDLSLNYLYNTLSIYIWVTL